MRAPFRRTAWCLAALLVLASPAFPASRFRPALRFQVLVTAHFRVYFHQGGETAARRLAQIAEQTRHTLSDRLRLPAPAVTHVVLVDQDDVSNGLATVVPDNTILLSASWPSSSDLLGRSDDWLRLVFAHEYTHIVQLDQAVGWAWAARRILGRSPLTFPNLCLPQWQIEGLATYEETRITGEGRMASGDARAVVLERARVIGLEPMGRFNGGSVEWPAGHGPYLVGGLFHEFLAQQHGEAVLGDVYRRTAGRLPYLSSRAFQQTVGRSLGTLWAEFQADLAARRSIEAASPATAPVTRLTTHGFIVSGPRFTDDGAAVLYSLSDADRFPALYLRPLASGMGPREVATRASGTHASVRGRSAFYDQVEVRDNVALESDLYHVDLDSGRTTRLTRHARLVEPDVSPDGHQLAAIRLEGGRRQLVACALVASTQGAQRLGPIADLTTDPDGVYGSPRWAPDGRRIVVERRQQGGPSELVVIDSGSGHREVLVTARARLATPTWTPDGRHVLFASDRAGSAFQVYAVEAAHPGPVRQATFVEGGATSPAVSPDGASLVFVGLNADGYDLYQQPLVPSTWRVVAGVDVTPPPLPEAEGSAASAPVARPYSLWPTLLPRAWLPMLDTDSDRWRVGVDVSGTDVLARHRYAVSLRWRLEAGGAPGSERQAWRPDWIAEYVYDRWRPAVTVSLADTTSDLPRVAASGERLADAALRERTALLGVQLPILRVRLAHAFRASLALERQTIEWPGEAHSYDRHGLRLAWVMATARQYDRSISLEDGVVAAVASEHIRTGLGSTANADTVTGELRTYARLWAAHDVLAVRVAAGASTGDANVLRRFGVGGTMRAAPLASLGADALNLFRGFDHHLARGARAAAATVEYRRPLWRLDRGWGTAPVLLRVVHGAVFVDAGHAWDRRPRLADAKVAAGVEVSLDLVAGFVLPVTAVGGASLAYDGATGRRSPGVYFRLGRSF